MIREGSHVLFIFMLEHLCQQFHLLLGDEFQQATRLHCFICTCIKVVATSGKSHRAALLLEN